MRKKITTGIYLIFRGLFFEHNAEIGQKDHLWMDTASTYSRHYSYPSRPTVEPDGNIALFHNNRHFSYAIGIFQHGLHLFSISLNINVFNFLTLLCKSFTSLICIRSGILPKNQYIICHGPTSLKNRSMNRTYLLEIQAIVESLQIKP